MDENIMNGGTSAIIGNTSINTQVQLQKSDAQAICTTPFAPANANTPANEVQMPTPRRFEGKDYYGTADVAKIIGVTRQNVSWWNQKELFTADVRTHDGIYLYEVERIMQLKSVYRSNWTRGSYEPNPPVDEKQKRIAEAEKFFNLLYGSVTERKFGYLWTKQDKATYPFTVSNADERKAMAIRAIELSDEGKDVYFGVNLMDESPSRNTRVKAAHVTLQTATITDIDILGGEHIDPEKYPADFDTAKSFLPFTPSLIINSGYGLHAYCIYSTPITISDENRKQATDLNKKFINAIQKRAGKFSKAVDSVHDLPRVLRVPGTYNYKCGKEHAPLCQLIETFDVRFTATDLEAKLKTETVVPKLATPKPARATAVYYSDDDTNLKEFRIRRMLDYINIVDGEYDKWLTVGFALFNEGMECNLWEQWSRAQPNFKDGECEAKWKSFHYDSNGNKIGTLYQYAIEGGYDEKETRREWYDLHPELLPVNSDDNHVHTRDKIKDCPVNLVVPSDFILSNRGITFVKPATEKKPEAHIPAIKTPVVVTKILSRQADGVQRYEIAIKSRGKWKFQEVTAKTLQSPRQIYDLAEYGCLIADAGLATRYFTSFIADNECDISELKVYSKPGWYDDGNRFIYPKPPENADYRVERNNIDYHAMFDTRGDLDLWIKKFRDVTNRSSIHRIYFGAGLAASLLDVLGLPNFWFHINGRRNLCKTPLMKFALSVFGNPEKIMRTFDASPKHLQTMAVGLNDFPMGIDEGETMTEKALAAFQTTIYNFVAGVDGQRNQRNGDVRVTEDFRGVRLSTSEQPLLRTSNKGGAYKRFIDLHLSEPLFNVTEGRELHLFVARCHGHFGRLWTEYIVTHAKEIRADFDKISNSLAIQHDEEYETAHLLNLAACATAFWHFRLLLKLDTKFEGDLARTDANIVLKQLPTQEEMDDSKRWLEILEGYVASHPKHFWRKVILPDGTIPTETFYAPMLYGRILDDDSVAIIASVFKSICEELNIPAEKFINELFEQNYLVDATRKNKAKLIRIGGDRTRAFVFKSGLLWNSERRDDAIDTEEGEKNSITKCSVTLE